MCGVCIACLCYQNIIIIYDLGKKGEREIRQLWGSRGKATTIVTPNIKRTCRRTGAVLLDYGDHTVWFVPRDEAQNTPTPQQTPKAQPKRTAQTPSMPTPKALPKRTTQIPSKITPKVQSKPTPIAQLKQTAQIPSKQKPQDPFTPKLSKELVVKIPRLTDSGIKKIQQDLKDHSSEIKNYVNLAVIDYLDKFFAKIAVASEEESSDEEIKRAIELSLEGARSLSGMISDFGNMHIGNLFF